MRKKINSLPWLMGALMALILLFAAACANGDGGEEQQTDTPAATPTTRPAPTAAPTATPEPPRLSVVTTTNIVHDWVANIGGGHVDVFSLLPVGADPHTFQPGARDAARIAEADLVLSIGLGLEEVWLHDLMESAAQDEEAIVELGEIVEPIEFGEGHAEEVELLEEISHVVHEVEEGEITPEVGIEELTELLEGVESDEEAIEHVLEVIAEVEGGQTEAEEAIETIEELTAGGEEEHADHGHGLEDPHFWFDPLRVKIAVDDIAARLSALDPSRSDAYTANAAAYNAELDELHAWTEEQVEVIPEERRLLVTSHDSFGYFANLYHFEVVGVVLSITTDVEPSAKDLADLVEVVKEHEVPAIFGETTVSERLAQAVASESGAELVRLYSGSLGAGDSDASTYVDMVRTNVRRITEALQ